MHNFVTKFLIAIALAVALSWAYLFMPQAFFSLDNRLRDFLFVLRGELPKEHKIVIIDIDEKSLQEYGQWPWSRNRVADLLYKLSDARAGIIGLDIVFAEEDRTSPHRYAKKYPALAKKLEDYDAILAKTLMQTPVIGGYVFTFEKNGAKRTPMIPAVFIEKGMQKNTILEPKGVVLNIPLLQDAMYSSGFFNNTPDADGIIRSVPLLMRYNGVLYPSLVMEMVRIYSGTNKVVVLGDEAGARRITFGKYSIPLDKVGRLGVNFRGKRRHFQYISAADILDGKFDKKAIENKFVLVGTSAVGLSDLRSTPYDSAIAGVEVHANVLDNILKGDYLKQPADIVVYDLMIIWATIFLFLCVFSLTKSWFIIPVAIISLYGLYELFFTLLFDYGMMFNLLFPLIAYFFTLVISEGVDYITASEQKEEAKRMLGKKVSPAVMEYLLKHSHEALVASREVEVTTLFSDIRSFTTISEKIASPDKLIHLLNEYMTPMVDNIVNHHGTIDKFIGDAIMAYWNAPVAVNNHADVAVESAIEQIEMLVDINRDIRPKYGVTIAIGIGINTGLVTAGDMGSDGRSDYTIIGDNVNLASRLEGLTKQYKAQILITKATFLQLKKKYKIRRIDLVEVKGKNEAVEIYEVLCNNKEVSEAELKEYEKATTLFREGAVEQAYAIYTKLQEEKPCVLYEHFCKRCKNFIENPELEFTPILKMTTK